MTDSKMPEPVAIKPAKSFSEYVAEAAVAWCGEKDRETFPEDITYFTHNWSSFPGFWPYVIRAALADPTPVADAELEAMIGDIETFINEPPRRYDIEPMDVRDYRHSLYPMWSKLITALRARTAQPVGVIYQHDLDQMMLQIKQNDDALMDLCRKHGMTGDLPMQWLDETLSALLPDGGA